MKQTKQVIILRKDLNMRLGKCVAQGAHASLRVFFKRMTTIGWLFGICRLTKAMCYWLNGSYAKIVVWCNSETELLNLKQQAEEAGIVNAIILDEGRTEFKEVCHACNGTGLSIAQVALRQAEPITAKRSAIDCKCLKCGGTGKVNKPTFTALAIGPDYVERIDPITKNLKLA